MSKDSTVATVSVEQVAQAFVHAIKLANTLGLQQSVHLSPERYADMTVPTRNNVVKSWNYTMDGDATDGDCTHRYDLSTYWTDVAENDTDDDDNTTVCDVALCIDIEGIASGSLNTLIADALHDDNDAWYHAPVSEEVL
jgi:hypothetical protein